MSKFPLDARRPNTASVYAPGASGTLAIRLKPDDWNCGPNAAATSGRSAPRVALPRKIGAPFEGIAHTSTASMPVPLVAD